jgi:hypothetical protein
MVSPWPSKPFTFRALAKTYGPMWLRCDACRRYARLNLAGLHEVDSRTKTFSCSRCGDNAGFCVVEPIKERGMEDYRLDDVDHPAHHPDAVRRLMGQPSRPRRRIDFSNGELPGRKVGARPPLFFEAATQAPYLMRSFSL